MAWQSSSIGEDLTWKLDSIEDGMNRDDIQASSMSSIWYNESSPLTYNPNKNYQFITTVKNFSRRGTATHSKFLQIFPPGWNDSFSYEENTNPLLDTRPQNSNEYSLLWYSSPTSIVTSNDRVEYRSTWNGFGNPASDGDGAPVITNFKLVEIDWFFQGWAIIKYGNGITIYRGWSFDSDENSIKWVSRVSIGTENQRDPINATVNNFASRYISYPIANIKFDFTSFGLGSIGVNIYMSSNRFSLSDSQFLGRIDSTDTDITFYNIVGERWLLFQADYVINVTNVIELSNFVIDGSYHSDNNKQFTFNSDLELISSDLGATYSIIITNDDTLHSASPSFFGPTGSPGFFSTIYGEVINLSQLNSRVGNGLFKAGIWENGVWNNGWRVDENSYDFIDVASTVQVNTRNNTWRIQIKGSKDVVSQFNIGDRISVGNIIGIDINEERKVLRGVYTIILKDDNNIVFEIINKFPLRRIERDSLNHKIKITKNVWLNGAFFNGYFEGVWNNGLFKGYPYITEMYNSHWIEGYFDGGHFYGEYPEWEFEDTFFWQPTNPNTLGLTSSQPHGLKIGDVININKNNKTINPQYDGNAEVIEVLTNNSLVVNRTYGIESNLESGNIVRKTGTSVIQHFKFKDNNVASKTTNDFKSLTPPEPVNLPEVYNYNSWIDVKYLTQSASNLNRNQISVGLPSLNNFEYSELNLYGFITEDVLSSESSFRNSYNLNSSNFTLGTKYKIFEDFLGPISEFNEPFDTTFGLMDNFYNNGWTYSPTASYSIIRTGDEKMEISKIASPSIFTRLNNTNIKIDKRRYSLIEFDLEYDSDSDNFFNIPFIYFYNIQLNSLNFPISDFVYHTRTENIKKYEYFYNRRSLDIFLMNLGGFTASFDNIKFYEVDMIPFFQYTTEEYINKAVQIPFQGIAPEIDYDDSLFSFISNVNIQLDSLSVQETTSVPTQNEEGTLINQNPSDRGFSQLL